MSNTTDKNTTVDTDIQDTITSETAQETTNNANDDPWATTDTSTTESDPWSSTDSSSTDADPWGAGGGGDIDTSSAGSDWLDAAPTDVAPDSFNLMDPFHNTLIPLDSWVTDAIDWIVLHFRPVFPRYSCTR
ncbi:glycine betaine/L-proline transport system permease protein ProW family protein [Proteus penneri ATCC 35198]|nr:glycine betaine/L-proline transport system permease protein ProW family protein [Proteus penneri ATCC 35198]